MERPFSREVSWRMNAWRGTKKFRAVIFPNHLGITWSGAELWIFLLQYNGSRPELLSIDDRVTS